MDDVVLHHGDCLAVLPTLAACSIDAIVTDPPYGLAFMGKDWDHGVPGQHFWQEALRVAKPGAHLLAFGGTRTHHRLMCAIEDAGWEIRDTIMWIYAQGFPKSADVSKMLDKQERGKWLKLCKAIDNMAEMSILEAWQEYSSSAKSAGLTFQKNAIETGTSTLKSGSVPVSAAPLASLESSIASAITAELSSSAVLHTSGEAWFIVPLLAGVSITELSDPASIVESQPESQEVTPNTEDFSVPLPAWVLQSERITDSLKADEALKIWLGSDKSSKAAATNALCAALTDDLKRIILSRSKTFLSLDMTQQTDFVSATTATITASTAESLISFTAGILKSKAIDRAAGAEREVVGSHGRSFRPHADGGNDGWARPSHDVIGSMTAPATDAARQWQGFGTALKPAWEPIIVARKPLAGTVAENVLAWGVGGINVDGCRIEVGSPWHRRNGGQRSRQAASVYARDEWTKTQMAQGANENGHAAGRWPANVVLSHDEGCRQVGTEWVRVNVAPGNRDRRGAQHGFGEARVARRDDVHPGYVAPDGTEMVEVWECVEGCAVRAMDEASGERRGGGYPEAGLQRKHYGIYGKPDLTRSGAIGPSIGGASRFYYCAKASGADRDEGLEGFEERIAGAMAGNQTTVPSRTAGDGVTPVKQVRRQNHHPTVKPTELMRWLVRLVTPPGGTVLDPFMGSGSTGKAAVLEGLGFVGIELDREYIELARRRIDAVRLPLFSLESEG